MPAWSDVQDEVRRLGSGHDVARRQHLAALAEYTKRNVIIYYSGWLQKGLILPGFSGFGINDLDKNGFMAACHQIDTKKGLDLVLHTPGGDASATESIVDYLRQIFGTNIRAIVPQLAMSAGTLIACACQKIIMGKQSSIGPIDPQIGNMAAHGVIEEFDNAQEAVRENPQSMILWQPIIAKYSPTLIGECRKALKLAESLAMSYLTSGMFAGAEDAEVKAQKIVSEIADHQKTMSHSRHISMKVAQDMGLDIDALESDPDLQDLVLTLHHSCMLTLQDTPAVKIIENQIGKSFISAIQIIQGMQPKLT